MGGANAPEAVINGISLAATKHPNVKFVVFGDSVRLLPLLTSHKALASRYEIVHCSHVITDDEQPVRALKRGTDSSMRKAIDMVKERRADACISCGNTGALMVMAKLVLGDIHGISRPAIASIFPNFNDGVVLLDLGANAECDAHNLFQFALMGHCFAQAVLHKKNPSIGLLNVGVEEYKGRDIDKKAYELLKTSSLNFYGYVEGHDIPEGKVDVVVTDGFSGNVVLKTAEGVASLCKDVLKQTFKGSIFGYIAAFLVRKRLKHIVDTFDPRNHNGAMFIGVDGVVVKSHGSSDDIAFANAVDATVNLVEQNINKHISSLLEQLTTEHRSDGSNMINKIIKKLGF